MKIISKSTGADPVKPKSRGWKRRDPISEDRYYSEDEILTAMQERYRELENAKLAETFKKLLEALSEMHPDGFFMHKDPRHLDALFELSTKTKFKGKDAQDKWTFETDTGASLHVKHGQISYEKAVLRTVGKSQKKIYKPFDEQDALNIALAAMHDRSLLPPNKVHISNATPRERMILEEAFKFVSKNYMPKGEGFKIDNHYPGGNIKAPRFVNQNFERFMYHAKDHQKQDTKQENIARQAENAQKTDNADKHTSTSDSTKKTKGAGKYSRAYNNLNEDERVYNTAKDLLLKRPDDYKDAPVMALARDVSQLLKRDDLSATQTNALLRRLEKDGIVTSGIANGSKTITDISFKAVKPQGDTTSAKVKQHQSGDIEHKYDERLYAKIASDLIHNPEAWMGKQRKDVLAFLKRDPKDKEGIAIWEQLKKDELIVVEKSQITAIASNLAGTEAGLNFARMANHVSLKDVVNGAVRVGKATTSASIKAGKASIKVGKKVAASKVGKAAGEAAIKMGEAFYKTGGSSNPFTAMHGVRTPRSTQTTGSNGPEAGTQP